MSDIHPAPDQFSTALLASNPILRFFHYAHLPAALQTVSRPFCDLAAHIVETLPMNAERSTALRKLLEAKDCAVRANVEKAGVGSSVASGNSFYARLVAERDELKTRLSKLNDYLAGEKAGATEFQIDMLRQQQVHMTEYLAILEARIENIQHEPAQQTRPAPDGEAVETGGHDEDRDGPIKFEG